MNEGLKGLQVSGKNSVELLPGNLLLQERNPALIAATALIPCLCCTLSNCHQL